MIPFPYLPIQPGDICKSKADNSQKPESYYLVMRCRSESEALVAPINRTYAKKEAQEEIIINNEAFWIDVLARQIIPISLLTAVSYNHIEIVRRIARKRSSVAKTCVKADKMQKSKVDDLNSFLTISNKKKKNPKTNGTQKTAIKKTKSTDPTANKILYIYKGRIVCHRQEHPIIPAAATFLAEMGKK
ncbi:MAG: hypothetical protein LIO78_02455 [Clostridiales bacterium]|nr:hypothetical protein [Clostridiales bacterium]